MNGRSRAQGPAPTTTTPPRATSRVIATDDMNRVELTGKAGKVHRVTTDQTIVCECTDCGRMFDSTGTAASHARSVRHTVKVIYMSAFAFVPDEHLPTAWRP